MSFKSGGKDVSGENFDKKSEPDLKHVEADATERLRTSLHNGGDKNAKHDAKEVVKSVVKEDQIEHMDAKQIEAHLAKFTKNMHATLFEVDPGTNTNLMQRMAANAPDLYKSFSETLSKSPLASMIVGENRGGPNFGAQLTDGTHDPEKVSALLAKIKPASA